MARVNIEEEFWSKACVIASKYGWRKREVIGMAADLWHNSQREGVVEADREKLVDLFEAWDLPAAEQDKIIEAFVWQDVLMDLDSGLWRIRGNKKHIEALRNLRENARLGGIAKAKKKSPAKRQPRGKQAAASSLADACPIQCNSMQFNSIHDNSASVGGAESSTPLNGPEVTDAQVIEAWNKAFPEKPFKGFGITGRHRDNFFRAAGYLPTAQHWRKLFEHCKTTKLGGSDPKFRCSWFCLTWILDHDNIADVWAGKYDMEQGDPTRQAKDLVEKIMGCLSKFPGDREGGQRAREHLGEPAWDLVRDAGGWKQLTTTPYGQLPAVRDKLRELAAAIGERQLA